MARWYLRRDLDSLLRLTGDLARVSFQDVESISLHFSQKKLNYRDATRERAHICNLLSTVCRCLLIEKQKNLKLRACTDRKEFEKKNPIIPSQGERDGCCADNSLEDWASRMLSCVHGRYRALGGCNFTEEFFQADTRALEQTHTQLLLWNESK